WSQMCPAAGCRNTRRLRLATERWTNELLDWPWCAQENSRPNHRKTDGQGNRHGPNFKPHGFLPVWASNLLKKTIKAVRIRRSLLTIVPSLRPRSVAALIFAPFRELRSRLALM